MSTRQDTRPKPAILTDLRRGIVCYGNHREIITGRAEPQRPSDNNYTVPMGLDTAAGW